MKEVKIVRPILILTKNLLVEQNLQKQLQYLSYEVFCSVELFERLMAREHYQETQSDIFKQLLINYQAIILSETLSDNEIQYLMPILTSKKSILLRKLCDKPSLKEEEKIKNIGINDWIITDHSIDYLREQLSEKLADYQKEEMNIVFLYPNQKETGDVSKLKASLSNREKSALSCLLEAKGEVVSREELCSCLWNEEPNNSHLSQASVLIKRIKMKLELAGYDPEMLKTVWGSGYLLAKSKLLNDFLFQTR